MVSWFMQMSLLFWLCVLGVSFLFSDQLKIDFIGMKNPKQNPQQSWPTNKWNDSLGILLVSMLSLFLPQNHNRVKFIGKQQKKLHKHYKHFLETLSHFFKGIIVTKRAHKNDSEYREYNFNIPYYLFFKEYIQDFESGIRNGKRIKKKKR